MFQRKLLFLAGGSTGNAVDQVPAEITRHRIISPNILTVHDGILHILRSHLDFLGLSDVILSNLAEPSNQQQLHQRRFLINQSSQ